MDKKYLTIHHEGRGKRFFTSFEVREKATEYAMFRADVSGVLVLCGEKAALVWGEF